MSEPADPTQNDRLLAPLRKIIRAELPQYTFLGLYEYIVQSSDGTTVDCDLDDTSVPLPASLKKIPLRSSILGEVATLSKGSRCLIAFVNGDPSRAVCIGADPTPSSATIEAKGTIPGTGTLTLKAGSYPATEHVATVEGVVNMFVNFVYFLNESGNPSTWAAGILNAADEPLMATFTTALTKWLTNCNLASPPNSANGGGIMFPLTLLATATQLATKIPDVIPGITPTGIGAPNVKTG